MSEPSRIYLVGRRNRTVSCDIELPESEKSVSRKHLELTVTASGQCYLVHVHPKNTTQVQASDGSWRRISQDYVALDTPLLLGEYRTTARQLLAMHRDSAPASVPEPAPQPEGRSPQLEWDPDAGTFKHR
jgi:pSer/pThr/pTyr-binding forkhead associated (FHA) protein